MCYRYSGTAKLKDAHQECRDYGGFLPIPRSNKEMDDFLKRFQRRRTGSRMYTGGGHSDNFSLVYY